jgi:flotillin
VDIFQFINSGQIAVVVIIVIVALLFAYATSRVKVAGANEALVRTGGVFGGAPAQLTVVRAGRVIVLPLVHKLGRLHLSARQINVALSDAVTKQGIKVAVQGVATVKIGGDDESIRNAAERFLDREELLDSIVKNVLEGSLRSIVGTLTVEELNYDRQKFQQEVQGAAKADLATSGLSIDNFTIQAIRDEVGYMDLIGQQETARRERDARMAKALADQEAAVREAEAQQIKLNAQRDVSLRQAEVESLTAAAEARAGQAGPLAQADAQQEVTRKQTELAQLEADRKAKELLASTVRPAEAEAEAQVKRAEGEKTARIRQAEADAERVRLAGQAEATVTVTKGEASAKIVSVTADAEAHRTQVEGNAEAGIVFTKGEAEAKALALRAEAYRQFNEAAVIQTVLSMLPEIVRAAAEPMGNIDNLTVFSADGASDIVKTTTRTVAEAGTAVKGLTGIDIPALLSSAMGGSRVDGDGTPTPPAPSGRGGGRTRARRPSGPSSTSPTPAAAPPIAQAGNGAAAGVDPEAAFARAGEALSRAARAARGAGTAATGTPPAPPSAAETTTTAQPATSPAAGTTDRAIGTPRPAVGRPAAVDIRAETTLDEAAARLASDLESIPGIERFGGLRLSELERSGPRPLRTLWRIARERVDARYGQLTIGELLDRARASGGSGPAASA